MSLAIASGMLPQTCGTLQSPRVETSSVSGTSSGSGQVGDETRIRV